MYQKVILSFICMLFMSLKVNAELEGKTKHLLLEKGFAISGYDVVSYFNAAEPARGNEKISFEYNGAIYLFRNNDNLELFKQNPEKFKVAYGGWCAYAMGKTGKKVKIDPLSYKLIDKKLYLFYTWGFITTLDSWNKEEEALKKQADLNWKKTNE